MKKNEQISRLIDVLHKIVEIKKSEPKQHDTRSKTAMKCIKCGVLLPAGSKFCDKCGTKQVKDKKCSCGKIIEEDFKFCPECGTSFAKETAADKKQAELKLKQATLDGMRKAFDFISNCGVYLDDCDFSIDSPLIIQASDSSESEIVEALLSAGANVDAVDSDNNTALHKACENGNNEIVKILLAHRADVDVENDDGETPLSLARDNGHKYIVGLLHKAGAEDDDDD